MRTARQRGLALMRMRSHCHTPSTASSKTSCRDGHPTRIMTAPFQSHKVIQVVNALVQPRTWWPINSISFFERWLDSPTDNRLHPYVVLLALHIVSLLLKKRHTHQHTLRSGPQSARCFETVASGHSNSEACSTLSRGPLSCIGLVRPSDSSKWCLAPRRRHRNASLRIRRRPWH